MPEDRRAEKKIFIMQQKTMSEVKACDTATLITYFMAGVGSVYLLNQVLQSTSRPTGPGRLREMGFEESLGEAVGPEYAGQDYYMAEEEPQLQAASLSRRGALGGSVYLGQNATPPPPKLLPGRRIYVPGNLPTNDVAQWRGSNSRFNKPRPSPVPGPIPRPPDSVPAVPKSEQVPKAPSVPKMVPKAIPKAAPAVARVAKNAAKIPATAVKRAPTPAASKGAAKRLGFMPEVSSNNRFTILPR